jgi:hypothetical protein
VEEERQTIIREALAQSHNTSPQRDQSTANDHATSSGIPTATPDTSASATTFLPQQQLRLTAQQKSEQQSSQFTLQRQLDQSPDSSANTKQPLQAQFGTQQDED